MEFTFGHASTAQALMDLPVGEIRTGRLAGILLAEGDPTILQNKASPLAIMKRGNFHKPPTATIQ